MMKNAIVAQSGGPTTAINASLAGVIKGCLESNKRLMYSMEPEMVLKV